MQKLFANEKIDEVINYFCKPKSIDIVNFFIFHPIQPTNSSLISLPFNEKIFFSDQGDCKFNRKWYLKFVYFFLDCLKSCYGLYFYIKYKLN